MGCYPAHHHASGSWRHLPLQECRTQRTDSCCFRCNCCSLSFRTSAILLRPLSTSGVTEASPTLTDSRCNYRVTAASSQSNICAVTSLLSPLIRSQFQTKTKWRRHKGDHRKGFIPFQNSQFPKFSVWLLGPWGLIAIISNNFKSCS